MILHADIANAGIKGLGIGDSGIGGMGAGSGISGLGIDGLGVAGSGIGGLGIGDSGIGGLGVAGSGIGDPAPAPSADEIRRRLFRLIRRGEVVFAGNIPGKIYGRLNCRSGRKMKRSNRIFFSSEAEAVAAGYRPCAVCMPEAFAQWKAGLAQLKRI